ncbi:MAG: hypothetical protein EOP83_27170 [Verrucomicrobiaceae bacterium]|nr:MAG: hypothetical protein EOP83_27170 [Verrucomicrobiaceae bacterium]
MQRSLFLRGCSGFLAVAPDIKRVLIVFGCAVLLAGLLSGCAGIKPRELEGGEFDPKMVTYFRDLRTETCFAVYAYTRTDSMNRDAGGLTMTEVPCTDKVLRLIQP